MHPTPKENNLGNCLIVAGINLILVSRPPLDPIK